MLKNNYNQEFLDFINPIITNPEFLKRKGFKHHGEKSVYTHSINVAYISFKICKKLKIEYKDIVVASLLHDFYSKPWQNQKKKPFFKKHGFVHGKEAAYNANMIYENYMNPKIITGIERHMFPLTIKPPSSVLGWIVTISDKIESFDVITHPSILISFFKKNRYH